MKKYRAIIALTIAIHTLTARVHASFDDGMYHLNQVSVVNSCLGALMTYFGIDLLKTVWNPQEISQKLVYEKYDAHDNKLTVITQLVKTTHKRSIYKKIILSIVPALITQWGVNYVYNEWRPVLRGFTE
ncbi:MAG: hypothetical protein WCE21_05265 [Candidatus Babeliales bacterium]